MKKNILFILLGFTVLNISCAEDVIYTGEFSNKLKGIYSLRTIDFDTPTDLNGDGVAGTNLFEELMPCEFTFPLLEYESTFRIEDNEKSIYFETPFSHYDGLNDQQTSCMRRIAIRRQIDIDYQNESVSLVPNEYEENFFYTEFKAKALDVVWQDGIIRVTLEQEFYKPNGEWETVILYIEYE